MFIDETLRPMGEAPTIGTTRQSTRHKAQVWGIWTTGGDTPDCWQEDLSGRRLEFISEQDAWAFIRARLPLVRHLAERGLLPFQVEPRPIESGE